MRDRKKRAVITGFGSYLPSKVLTNSDLEKIVDTSDEWITTRTGMKERRIAAEGETPSKMGARAAERALASAGVSPHDVDLIITATMTPDHLCPSTAALIQQELGATAAASFDLSAACSGYIYALSVAKAMIENESAKTILLVATEKMSSFIDYHDRTTCVLFGDGAAASVVQAEGRGLAIQQVSLGSDGSLGDLLKIPAGGASEPATHETIDEGKHFVQMQGRELFRHAVRKMTEAAQESLKKAGLQQEEIGWLVPHQANIRIIDAMAKNFSLPPDRVYKTVHKYGNTSASTIPIALEELSAAGKIRTGEPILLVAFGGGLTWGSAILTREGE